MALPKINFDYLLKRCIMHAHPEYAAGGSAALYKGWFVNDTALKTAYPVGVDGNYASVGSTDTVWLWDSDTTDWVDSSVSGTTLGGLGDVTIPTPVLNDILVYTGAVWENLSALPAGTLPTGGTWTLSSLMNIVGGANPLQLDVPITTALSPVPSGVVTVQDQGGGISLQVPTATLSHEFGGLEADVSAYNGLLKISGGTTSFIADNSAAWDAKQDALTFDAVPTDASTNPVESGGVFSSLVDLVSVTVADVTHTFTGLEVVYNDGSNWVLAQANDPDTLGVGIITKVNAAVDYTVQTVGMATVTAHGLTVGEYYFLSDTAAGSLVLFPPTAESSFNNPLLYVVDANTIFIFPWRPIEALSRKKTSITPASAVFNCGEITEMVICDATTAAFDVNLLPPEAKYAGYEFTVKKIDASVNAITVKSATGTIDGVLGTTGKVIPGQNDSFTFVCDGADYYIK